MSPPSYQPNFKQLEERLGEKSFFYSHDPRGVFTYVSPSIVRVLGYSREDFLHHYETYMSDHPENKRVVKYTEMSLSGQQPPSYPVQILHKNGELKWLQVEEFPVFDDKGKVVSVEGMATDITKYKTALEELEKQTQRLERAQRMAHIGSWESDFSTGKLYWSAEAFRIFEYDPEKHIPSNELFLARIHPDDRAAADKAYQNSLEDQRPYRMEHRLLMDDGRIKYVLEECETIFDPDGRPLISNGTVQDITAYRIAKQQVQREQALLAETESIAHIGSWELDLNTQDVWYSAGCLQVHGFESHTEVKREDFLAQVPEGEREAIESAMERAILTGKETTVIHSITLDDGTQRYLRHKSLARYDDHGRPVRLVGTSQDITEQYLAEERVREQKMLLKSVMNASPDLIFYKDPHGVYRGCNQAFEAFTGKREEEILGKTDFDLFDKSIAAFFREQDLAMFKSGRPRQNEEWVTYPDGSRVLLDTVKTPFYSEEGTLYGLMGISRDITSRKEAEAKLYHLAHHDQLTGLANRQLFSNLLLQAIAQSARELQKLAVLFIDLDHFKQINDSLGHLTGDKILEQVGNRLQGVVRQSDSMARLGGDEFALLVRNLKEPEDAVSIAGKVLEVLGQPFDEGGNKLYIGASIGISVYPQDGDTPEILLRNADAAMYHAKASNRNTYAFYTDRLTQVAFEHIQLESELRRAIEGEEFEVYYQPKLECQSGRIVGAEALIRWNHPEKGLLLPGSFIQEAERSDLIIQMGEWVLEQACAQNTRWQQLGLNPGKVSVNLSGKQIAQSDLAKKVIQVLDKTECQPEWLELEIIERFVMSSPEQTLKVLEELHKLGVHFALDDFGIEYSSLTYLKQLPLNTLKIDYSFVRDIPEDANDMAIVEAILSLAQTFGFHTVAEGVERAEQLEVLHKAGAQYVQGFLFSRPLPAAEYEVLLSKQQAGELLQYKTVE
ncbi:EAL domain-containing protein [Thiomicrorhabdus sp. zzn3]|uniref:sensor domain-containing protein n=1 Tax=Thiomicrorhabdus sp. zzn3 TaxID=3039775 RepID=UPI002436F268|nr:bifunctional diguanylate cyclase/phosphodiesterase [Thiomicrorhabdus sp. zzn3]MDG6777091.1 EAL domain-containing protein [Thiomicrorhabdus sp. zzn3]